MVVVICRCREVAVKYVFACCYFKEPSVILIIFGAKGLRGLQACSNASGPAFPAIALDDDVDKSLVAPDEFTITCSW